MNNYKKQKKNSLTKVYISALVLIALFTITSQITTQYFLGQQDTDGHTINIAGRQRMLSQKITKQALLLFQTKNKADFKKEKKLLKENLSLWKKSHIALQKGSKDLEIPKPQLSKEIQELFSRIEPFYEKIEKTGNKILLLDLQIVNNNNNLLKDITANEASFLKFMNDIVYQFEKESKAKISQLKIIEEILMITTLVILLLEALFIFRPITQKIKAFIQEIQVKNEKLLITQTQLQENIEELKTSEENLKQSQEEILAQRDALDEQNQLLDEKNNKVNSSIRAAFEIQRAVLPEQSEMDRLLKDYFIINRPKDVVSGDFYWLNEVEGKTVLVVADCTGHGVPGAFMTLIGANLLNKIVRVWNIIEPAEILNRLHLEIQKALRQKTNSDNDNGMELVVVCWKKQDKEVKLSFAGAKNPLFLYLEEELKEIKGTRKAIGGIKKDDVSFKQEDMILPTGTTFYVGSDGLQDQSDTKRKKFGKARLKDLFHRIAKLPMKIQQSKIKEALDAHQQSAEQRDDILWIGVKL